MFCNIWIRSHNWFAHAREATIHCTTNKILSTQGEIACDVYDILNLLRVRHLKAIKNLCAGDVQHDIYSVNRCRRHDKSWKSIVTTRCVLCTVQRIVRCTIFVMTSTTPALPLTSIPRNHKWQLFHSENTHTRVLHCKWLVTARIIRFATT